MGLALHIEITGLANGAPVEVVGSGEIDAGRLRLEVRTLRANLAFDPALVAVGILDVLAVVGNALGKTDPAHVRSRTDLYDEHGREAGGWRVLCDEHGREAGGWRVLAALTSGTLRLQAQLLDHRTYLEPGEQVRSVQPWVVLAQPLEPEGLLLSGAWHVETGRGNGYRCVSLAVVERDLVEFVARLGFGPVRVRRETEGSAERIAVEAVAALAEEPA